MSPDPARTFLDACADIENILKRRYNMGEEVRGLGDVLKVARSKKDAQVLRYKDDLMAFKELRNAISHESYREGDPIATPLPSTVAKITQIRDQLATPPTVGSKAHPASVFRVDTTDKLWPRLEEMLRLSYSQAPVFRDGRYVGALTTNAVARWVASNIDDAGDVVIVDGATVDDVLKYAEPHETFRFVKRTMTVVEAIERLLSATPPLGLIVTQNGKEHEAPIGILVAGDLPDLTKSVEVTANG